MKLIKYTLNTNGTIPEYITDGGYLSVRNSDASPRDWDLVGVANNDAPQTGFVNEVALLAYAQEKNLVFTDPITKEVTPTETVVSSTWLKLG